MRAQARKRPMHLRAVEPDDVRAARLASLSDLLAERLSSHPVPSPVIAAAEPGRGWRTVRQLGAVAVLAGVAAAIATALPQLPGEPSGMRPLEQAVASAAEAATPSPPLAVVAPATTSEPVVPREPQPVTAVPMIATPAPEVLQAGPAGDPGKPLPAERELTWEEVHELQKRLQALSFEPGPLDGLKGPMTAAAVRRFEKARGLPETGEINLTTLSRLR